MSFFSYEPQVRQKGFSPGHSPTNDLFMANHHDPFRKFPPTLDFADELASLTDQPTPRPVPYDDPAYHRPHNIFDISAPTPDPPPGFNSTLPALNSSMRYEPHPDPPPSSFPSTHFRHTPSPIHHPHHHSRSRSTSRPPSSSAAGPARTTRTRRNNSVSSTSPPPHSARPQAIVIPGSHRMTASVGTGGPWFINSHSSASDFSLPTPDSHHNNAHQGYTPFSLNSPTDMHLPPLSHSLSHGAAMPTTAAPGSGPTKDHHHHHHHHLSLSSSIGSNGTIVNGINGLGIGISPPHSHAVLGPPSGGTNTTNAVVSQTAAEKQAAIANEKRRRRRESHNAVERRRRDNINEKISELATLIPECMLDVGVGNATTSTGTPSMEDPMLSPISPVDVVPGLKKEEDGGSATTTTTPDNGVVKANKGMILRKSVEYIRYLQQLVTAQGARNRELEQELKSYRGQIETGASPPSMSTSLVPPPSAMGEGSKMVVLADPVLTSSIAGAVGTSSFNLTTTNEDEELMELDPSQQPSSYRQGHGSEEGSLSPAGSLEGGGENQEERGRTREVVVHPHHSTTTTGRRVGSGGAEVMGMGLVAMET